MKQITKNWIIRTIFWPVFQADIIDILLSRLTEVDKSLLIVTSVLCAAGLLVPGSWWLLVLILYVVGIVTEVIQRLITMYTDHKEDQSLDDKMNGKEVDENKLKVMNKKAESIGEFLFNIENGLGSLLVAWAFKEVAFFVAKTIFKF